MGLGRGWSRLSQRAAGMAAIARNFDLVFRVFAELAAIFFIISDDATARRVGTFSLFNSSHAGCFEISTRQNRPNLRYSSESRLTP
jgi:hypothetical protein